MKKIAAVFVAAMVVGGAAWAQAPSAPSAEDGKKGIVDLSVSPTGSIERRSSAGMFSSDIDSFINPRFYDSKIGTFLFAGADIPNDAGRFDFGFAKAIGDLYLGFYYGGGLLNASGDLVPADKDPDSPKAVTDKANWNSDFAVLLGIAGMGIRLDAHVPTITNGTRNVGKQAGDDVDNLTRNVTDAPSFALTWGSRMGDLAPWARVGYKFADVVLDDNRKPAPTEIGYTRTAKDAQIEVSGGAEYAIGEGAVGGELNVGFNLPKVITTKKVPDGMKENTLREGGLFGVGISGYYSRTIDFGGGVKLGFSPNLGFALSAQSNSAADNDNSVMNQGDIWTSLDLGVDMGITWQISQKAAVFTGASMRAFDWTTRGYTGKTQAVEGGEKTENKSSSWSMTGVGIDTNNFMIGMTYSPVENLTIGLALNDFIMGLFGTSAGPSFDFTVSAKL